MNGQLSMAMLNNQRVGLCNFKCLKLVEMDSLTLDIRKWFSYDTMKQWHAMKGAKHSRVEYQNIGTI